MTPNLLRAELMRQADAAGLDATQGADLLEWADTITTGTALLECIENGWMKISGMRDGEPTFSLTEAGKKHVETDLLPQMQQKEGGR